MGSDRNFCRFKEAGVVINGEKCLFAVPELYFLGHRVLVAGVTPLPSRVAALQKHPRLRPVKELRGFLGAVNFYCIFISGATWILKHFINLVKGSEKHCGC